MKSAVLFCALAMTVVSEGSIQARVLAASEKAIIREAVSEDFFDPDSAKFRWLPLPSKLEGSLYCGSVNAKNRYGAYTGYDAFAVVVDLKGGKVTQAVSLTSIRNYDAEVYQMLCAQHGMDVRRAR